jgi:HEAT repeat protein
MLTIYCPACYAANDEWDTMCKKCGGPLTEERAGDFTERLVWALRHPEPTVAPRAAWILGERRDPRAVEPLIALVEHSKDLGVLEEATVALGKIGDRRALSVLRNLLADSYVSVRERAAWALGKIGDPDAIPALRQALTDTSQAVRSAAQSALECLESTIGGKR